MHKLTDEEKQKIDFELYINKKTLSEIADRMALPLSKIIDYRVSKLENKKPVAAGNKRQHIKELKSAVSCMRKRNKPPQIRSGNKYLGIMKAICERNYDGVESGDIRQYLREQGEMDGADYGIKSLTGGELKILQKNYLVYCCLSDPEKYFLNREGRDLLKYLERKI